jgi:hypothetical protein
MAFINAPMGGASAEFDGMPWQLALKRTVGVERATEKCILVLSDGKTVCQGRTAGTLHARLCQAKEAKRHDTFVHKRVKHTMQRLCQHHLRVRVQDENRTPFIASEQPDLRMDIVLPAHAFPLTGYDGPARQLPLMVDVTCVEAQCMSNARKTMRNPEQCCTDREAKNHTRYSAHYDQNCYKLATLAIGSFGTLGAEGRKLLGAMAEEWSAREAAPGSAQPRALKGIGISRIRAALSASLQMALSARVMDHMAATRHAGGYGDDLWEALEEGRGRTGTDCRCCSKMWM